MPLVFGFVGALIVMMGFPAGYLGSTQAEAEAIFASFAAVGLIVMCLGFFSGGCSSSSSSSYSSKAEDAEFTRRKKKIAQLEKQGVISNVKEQNGETTFSYDPEFLPALKGMGLVE